MESFREQLARLMHSVVDEPDYLYSVRYPTAPYGVPQHLDGGGIVMLNAAGHGGGLHTLGGKGTCKENMSCRACKRQRSRIRWQTEGWMGERGLMNQREEGGK